MFKQVNVKLCIKENYKLICESKKDNQMVVFGLDDNLLSFRINEDSSIIICAYLLLALNTEQLISQLLKQVNVTSVSFYVE